MKEKLDQQAYEYLKRKIITGELAPKQSLTESEISAELNISRTPVRSAMKMLESSQLVEIIPGRGAFVTDVSIQDIRELFDYRILLECAALKNYMQMVPAVVVDQFIADFSECKKMEEFNEDYHVLDMNFHMEIIRYIGNSRMLTTYMHLHDQIDRFRHIAALDPARLRSTPDEHLYILQAVKQGDAEMAQAMLSGHLENVKRSTEAAFGLYMKDTSGIFRTA